MSSLSVISDLGYTVDIVSDKDPIGERHLPRLSARTVGCEIPRREDAVRVGGGWQRLSRVAQTGKRKSVLWHGVCGPGAPELPIQFFELRDRQDLTVRFEPAVVVKSRSINRMNERSASPCWIE